MKRDVVLLSSQYWADNWFRKHHFAWRLAQNGHSVLYVEPSHSIARMANAAGIGSNPLLGMRIRSVAPGLNVMTPGRLMPKPNDPLSARVNSHLTMKRVRRAESVLGMTKPLYWVYDPKYAPALAKELHNGDVLLDLVDDLVEYPGSPRSRSHMRRCIHEMTCHSRRVIYTSSRLAELYAAPVASKVVPNGFDSALFRVGVQPSSVQGSGPVVGFIGTLFGFLDFRYFEAIADAVPSMTLVLVGRIEGTELEMSRLLERPNVIHVGAVPREEVPGWVAGFDVCIAPFKTGAVADAVSPLKLYEYLAMGKAVVCTPMASVSADSIGHVVIFASTPEEFVRFVREIVRNCPYDKEYLTAVVADYSWDALYSRVEEYARDILWK